MEPDDWLEHLRERPDFQERALALRSDTAGLDVYLEEFFHLATLPEAMRGPVLARLRRTVVLYNLSTATGLYQACAHELRSEYQRSLSHGLAPAEWGHLLLYPADFEETVLSLRSDAAAAHRYLEEVFRDPMRLLDMPAAAQVAAVERLWAMVSVHDSTEQGGLLPKCMEALYDEIPARTMTENRHVRSHIATRANPSLSRKPWRPIHYSHPRASRRGFTDRRGSGTSSSSLVSKAGHPPTLRLVTRTRAPGLIGAQAA